MRDPSIESTNIIQQDKTSNSDGNARQSRDDTYTYRCECAFVRSRPQNVREERGLSSIAFTLLDTNYMDRTTGLEIVFLYWYLLLVLPPCGSASSNLYLSFFSRNSDSSHVRRNFLTSSPTEIPFEDFSHGIRSWLA
jgi:hypothetical protein